MLDVLTLTILVVDVILATLVVGVTFACVHVATWAIERTIISLEQEQRRRRRASFRRLNPDPAVRERARRRAIVRSVR